MKVIRADILGYCMGVRKAVEAAEDALHRYTGRKVYTLGPLIHNSVVLQKLGESGLRIMDPENIETATANDVIIIRAHGVPPSVKQRLAERGSIVIDATCPRVMLSQQRAADYSGKGWTVIFAGDKGHGEVTGIAGCAGNRFVLLRSLVDAEVFINGDVTLPEHAVFLSQTTFSSKEFYAMAEILKTKLPSLTIINSICPATRERQLALEKLCKFVDGVLVIGGRNSANTTRLFLQAKKLCKHAAFIERATEIPSEFFNLDCVGLTAGASTPDSVISQVETYLTAKGRR